MGPFEFGDDNGCRTPGDPAFFLWLPLALLMPGTSFLALSLLSLRVALGGLWAAVRAFFPVPSLQAMRWAIARARAPWGALPVDLHFVKEGLELTFGG